MKNIHTNQSLLSNPTVRIAIITVLILCIPLVAMQFSDEVQWGPIDFVVIGALLFGSGLIYQVIDKRLKTKKHRLLAAIGVGLLVLYVWAELAVGIFTNLGS